MNQLDTTVLLFINGMHNAFLDQFMWLISAKTVWIPFYLITLWVVYRNRGVRGVISLALMIGIMMLFTDTLNASVIRPWIHRLRPTNLDNPISPLVHIVNGYRGGACGFPSAHAANYWGITLLVAYMLRSKKALASLALLTLVICYSRSYLGVHYPGDLLAGIIYATVVSGLIVCLYSKYFEKHEPFVKQYEWLPAITAGLTLLVFAVIALF